MAQQRGILDEEKGLVGFDEGRAVRRAGMCFTQNDNPLSRREVAGLRLRPEVVQRDLDTTDRVRYWHHDWKTVAVDPGRTHHDAIHRLIRVELKRSRHERAGEVETDVGDEKEGK
jgi:hypothetical protein